MPTTRQAAKLLSAVTVILPACFVIRHLLRKFAMTTEGLAETAWLTTSPRWGVENNYKEILLNKKNNIDPIHDLKIDDVIAKSTNFPIPFPVETVRCSYLKKKIPTKVLEKNINSAYPVIHEYALLLCAQFLNYQSQSGNTEFYKNMSLLDFIDRLLRKRAVAFVDRSDHYLLLDGTQGGGKWESIGDQNERPPLILENCLSYDEIKLAALLSVSSHSFFINDGARNNEGRYDGLRQRIEENGVIIGLIGARLEKKHVMEYREIMKTKEQNTKKLGYGEDSLQGKFLEFYGDINATYEDLKEQIEASPDRYIELGRGKDFFDSLMFERRIALSIDTLLIEANDRAKKTGKKAFIHVVGLGLGVWRIYQGQDKIFMDTFAKRLEFFKDVLTDISDVRFAYIPYKKAGNYNDGDKINSVTIHIENRNPQEKLKNEDEGKLLIVSYAWDGNALPGNEFWLGHLSASGDPAAAASSQISELHNCHINNKVRASNLRVATLNGLVTFQEYQALHKND